MLCVYDNCKSNHTTLFSLSISAIVARFFQCAECTGCILFPLLSLSFAYQPLFSFFKRRTLIYAKRLCFLLTMVNSDWFSCTFQQNFFSSFLFAGFPFIFIANILREGFILNERFARKFTQKVKHDSERASETTSAHSERDNCCCLCLTFLIRFVMIVRRKQQWKQFSVYNFDKITHFNVNACCYFCCYLENRPIGERKKKINWNLFE